MHLVEKQILEVKLPAKMGNQSQFVDLFPAPFQDRITQTLEDVFDKTSRDISLRIDRLDINLGRIPKERSEDIFLARLQDKLSAALKEKLASPEPGDSVRINEEQGNAEGFSNSSEALLMFLETGHLAWWHQSTDSITISTEFARLIKDNPTFIQSVKELLNRSHPARTRLVAQFETNAVTSLIKESNRPVADIYEALDTLDAHISISRDSIFFLKIAMIEVSIKDTSVFQIPEAAAESIIAKFTHHQQTHVIYFLGRFQQTLSGQAQEIIQDVEQRLRTISIEPSSDENLSNEAIQTKKQDGDVVQNDYVDTSPALKDNLNTRSEAVSDSQNSMKASTEENAQSLENESSNPASDMKEALMAPFSSDAPTASKSLEDRSTPSKAQAALNEDSKRGLYIQNAGLALLHPFFPHLFKKLGWIEDGEFVEEALAARAALLTEFVVNPFEQHFEPYLKLNKLLCGIDLETPLLKKFQPTDLEEAEITDLLQSCIQHWKSLGNTSIEGLREGFLRREGKLTLGSSGWSLKVERKTLDVLRDSLPWSLQLVKYPWMPQPLFIEW